MGKMSREYLTAYNQKNKAKIAAQQAARDAKKRIARQSDPVAMAQYRAKRRQEYLRMHPDAKTMEEIVEQRRAAKQARNVVKMEAPIGVRVCEGCNTSKSLDQYAQQGTYGRKKICRECSKQAPKVRKPAKKKELPVFKVSSEPKAAPPAFKTTWDDKLLQDGWVKLLGHTDVCEWIKVFVRNGVILYVRGTIGSYSTGKQTYGVMFDDSGKRYPTLGAAERVAGRMMA